MPDAPRLHAPFHRVGQLLVNLTGSRLAVPFAWPAMQSASVRSAAESESVAVNGAAVGCPGEGVRPSFPIIGTKETAP